MATAVLLLQYLWESSDTEMSGNPTGQQVEVSGHSNGLLFPPNLMVNQDFPRPDPVSFSRSSWQKRANTLQSSTSPPIVGAS
jgi:hypothetical protein